MRFQTDPGAPFVEMLRVLNRSRPEHAILGEVLGAIQLGPILGHPDTIDQIRQVGRLRLTRIDGLLEKRQATLLEFPILISVLHQQPGRVSGPLSHEITTRPAMLGDHRLEELGVVGIDGPALLDHLLRPGLTWRDRRPHLLITLHTTQQLLTEYDIDHARPSTE